MGVWENFVRGQEYCVTSMMVKGHAPQRKTIGGVCVCGGGGGGGSEEDRYHVQ